MSTSLIFNIRPVIIPIVGATNLLFPVRRIYCVGQNFSEHAKEMGGSVSKSNPFFFTKPNDSIITNINNYTCITHVNAKYPPMTDNYQHEVELVVAIGNNNNNNNNKQNNNNNNNKQNNNNNNNNKEETMYSAISPQEVHNIIFGYAVGIDFTRRDLQCIAKSKGKPWDLSKGADESAPISSIIPVEILQKENPALFYNNNNNISTVLQSGEIELSVNGEMKQKGNLSSFVTPIDELISILSHSIALAPGDIIFTGTPAGVSAVNVGDVIKARIEGVGELNVRIK